MNDLTKLDIVKLIRIQTMCMTQKAFANKNNVSTATLCEILKGDTPPSDKFSRIVGYTKIGPDQYRKV